MAGEWKTVPLGELYEFRSGLSKPRSEFGFGHGFLTFKNVLDNYFVPDTLTALVNSTANERNSCSVRRGDVFLTRTSETQKDLGMSCVALKDYECVTFNGFTKRLRPRPDASIVPEYAVYYFRSPRFRRDVTAMSSLSTRASLNNEMLERLTIVLPPVEVQAAIGRVLKTLDDKIELNRRISETLEAMTRAIFKSWFVDFDPVRAKAEGRNPGLPKSIADLFPDSFEDSELGKIPKGWKATCLRDVVDIFDSKRIPLSGRERAKQQGMYPYYGAAGILDHVDDYLFDDIYVLLGEDGSVVNDDGTPVVQYVWGKFWVNNHAHVLQGKNGLCSEHVMLHLRQCNIVPFVTGAVQPKLNQGNMNQIDFLLPSTSVCDCFRDIIAPLFAQYRACVEESRTLTTTRDALLPKLLSGELRLPEAKRLTKDAMP